MLQTHNIIGGKKTMERQSKVVENLAKGAISTVLDILLIVGIQVAIVLILANLIHGVEMYKGPMFLCSNSLLILIAQFIPQKKKKKNDKAAKDKDIYEPIYKILADMEPHCMMNYNPKPDQKQK